ncbi:MAG: (d)CMP kinase [Lachnospiraceae bacterium]|jgi:cytidylate kinase|nr:(d)CMP kinase [Lachnospiraceae bacterium]
MSYQIAIDGPAGAGKSTIAKAVAKELSFVYVDTGAMYRAMALLCIREGLDKTDEEAVSSSCEKAVVEIKYQDGAQVVFLNGENVNGLIRTQEVGDMASAISVYGRVREKLVRLQQELAKKVDVVMDGRDIASCVLPDADLKIYLDADVSVRAKRRYDELVAKGEKPCLTRIEEEVKERDYRDMHRDISPLVRVPEAMLVDSSYMTIEEVKKCIIDAFKGKTK